MRISTLKFATGDCAETTPAMQLKEEKAEVDQGSDEKALEEADVSHIGSGFKRWV